MEAASIIARFRADTSQFTQQVTAAKEAVASFHESLTTLRSGLQNIAGEAGMAGAALSAGFTLPLAALFKLGLGFDDIKRRTEITFGVMYHSAQTAKSLVSELSNLSLATPFTFRDILQSSKMLAGGGIAPGDIISTIHAISLASSGSDGTGASMQRIARALIEIKNSSGPVGMQFRMLQNDAHINAWQLLGTELHKTQSELKKLVKSGALNGDAIFKDLTAGMANKFKGLNTGIMNTLSGSFTNLKDAADQTFGALFKPLYNGLVKAIQSMSSFALSVKEIFIRLSPQIRSAISSFLLMLATAGPLALAIAGVSMAASVLISPMGAIAVAVAAVTGYLITNKDALDTLCTWLKVLVPAALGIATAALVAFGAVAIKSAIESMGAFGASAIAFLATPIGIAAAAIAVSVAIISGAFIEFISVCWDTTSSIKTTWARIQVTIEVACSAIAYVINSLVLFISQQISSMFQDIRALAKLLGRIIPGGSGFFGSIAYSALIASQTVQTGASIIMNAVNGIRTNVANGLENGLFSIKKMALGISNFKIPAWNSASVGTGKDSAHVHANPVASYLLQQQKQLYDLHHTGAVADAVWSRLHGALKKATQAQYSQAIATAKQLDATKAIVAVMKNYRTEVASLQKQLALGSNPTAMESLHYSFNHSRSGMNHTQRMHLLSLQGGVDAAAARKKLNDQISASNNAAMTAYNERLNSSYSSVSSSIKNMQKAMALGQHPTELQKVLFDQAGSAAQRAANDGNLYAVMLLKLQRYTARQLDAQTALNASTKLFSDVSKSAADKVLAAQTKLAAATGTHPGWIAFLSSYADKMKRMNLGDQVKALTGLRRAYEQIAISDRQAASQTGFRTYMANLRREQIQANAHGGFNKFSASFLKNEHGQVQQPYTNAQLQQMYTMFQKIHGAMTGFQEQMKKAAHALQDGFQKALQGLFQHGFKNFFKNVVGGFDQMLQQMAAKWLSSQMMHLFAQGLGSLVTALGGNGKSITSAFGGFRAAGGSVSSGVPYMVGEQGPEMFVPHSGGHIVPNHQLGGGHIFHITINNPADGNSVRQSMGQAMNDAGRQMAYWNGRNG